MDIQWFPGHMAKAKRLMEEQLKLVDIIIELRDARMPNASENPLLKTLANNKPRILVLNKADMADPLENEKWVKHFEELGFPCLLLDSSHDNNTSKVVNEIKRILKDKLDKAKARGIRKKVLRAMVVGIPNVGKSTFINNVVKRKVAKAENRPGVTKDLQWIKINEDVELLDTPGVLWPKFDSQKDATILALLGSINDDVLDKEVLVNYGITYLIDNYNDLLCKRYELKDDNDVLFNIASKRGLLKANEINKDALYSILLKEFRTNALGRITWEKCDAN